MQNANTFVFTCKCGQTREVYSGSRHEVTRCHECQMENKRLKARERYRRRKKISKKQAEAKAAAKAEKKAAAEVKAAEVKAAEDEATAAAEAAVFDDDVIISPWNKPQAKKPVRTPTKKLSPEEEAAYISKTKFVFAAFNGDSDDNDDW